MFVIILLITACVAFSEIILKSNYPLRGNNLPSKIKREELPLILWVLQQIRDVKDVRLKKEGENIILYIERYPIIKNIRIEGNRFFSDNEIKNILGLREEEPIEEFTVENIKRTLEVIYRERGFLDVKVNVELNIDKQGYAELIIKVNEGDVYIFGKPLFEGNEYYSEEILQKVIKLPEGDFYSELKAKEGVEKLRKFYRNNGFLDSSVYLKELKKEKIKKFYFKVFYPEVSDSEMLKVLKGLSNFLEHPREVLRAFLGRGNLIRPVYRIYEGEKYTIIFKGNKYFSDNTLKEILKIEDFWIDIFSIERAKRKLIEFYKTKGFFDVKVNYVYKDKTLEFLIDEGERYKLKVLGLKYLKFPEYYDKEVVEKVIEEFLEKEKERGYLEAKVRVIEEIDRISKRVDLIIIYDKGKKYFIKKIIYKGKNKKLKEIFEKYNKELPKILKEDFLESLHSEINKFFLDEGFLDGDFFVDIHVEETEDTIYLTYVYEIKTGERYRYGKLFVYGNDKTRYREIYYTVVKQKYFSSKAEEESLWNLIDSENFSGVRIVHFADKEKKVVHRFIEVREDKRGLIELAIGYNTEEKLKTEGLLKLKNLLGIGIILELKASLSELYETYEVSLSDKYLFSRKYFTKNSIFRRLEFHRFFDLESEGFLISLGYRPKRYWAFILSFSQTEDKVVNSSEENYLLSRVAFNLVYEKKDDVINPKNITHLSLKFTEVFGSRKYTKTEFNGFLLKEVTRFFSFNTGLFIGSVGKDAPIFDRYFLGGLRNMKGYGFESIGAPEGGRRVIFAKFEGLYAIRKPFYIGMFTDVGNTGNTFKEVFSNLKQDVGFTAGVSTPAGFIRLDIAKPVEEIDKVLKNFRIYFSVGFVY